MNPFRTWLSERSPSGLIGSFLRKKQVPVHRHDHWYLLGGLTLLFFLVQVVSGVMLSLYYQPTPETAHESVAGIVGSVSYGWLVRSVHKWSSHLVIACAILHLFSKFYFRAYRAPRELTWISGVLLILVLLAFAFTGHLLPWDTNGYFATQIGTEIPRSTPVIGPFIVTLLRGPGEYVDATGLTRMFGLHVVILPLISLFLIGFHLLMNQFTGSASPAGTKTTSSVAFHPDFALRDAMAWFFGIAVLFTMVMLVPVGLGPKADILASPPPGIHPEWYFLPLYQAIRLLPGSIGGIHTEAILNLAVGLLIAGLFLVPWIDRTAGSMYGVGWSFLRLMGYAIILFATLSIIITYI